MTITVLLFASYADALGRTRVEVPLPEGSTVAQLVERVLALPGAAALPAAPAVAVNQTITSPQRVLRPDDEVAIIPPVAGG